MKALVFDAPAADTSSSRVAELDVPEPGAGQVSIDVRCAGVNFKDLMARRGDAGYAAEWPFVPGLEVAGTVRACGIGVHGLHIGQRVAAVTNSGGLADIALANAELTVPVPDRLALEVAAAAPGALATAALLVLAAGRLQPGESVLVHSAAGGVGQAVARLARAAGARLALGSVGDAGRAPTAERAGYDAVFVRGPNLASRVRERGGGDGMDVLLDPQGTTLLDLDLDLAAPGGRVILFGNAPGGALGALPPAGRLLAGNISIGGFSLAEGRGHGKYVARLG